MEQAEHQAELSVLILFEHTAEVKLDVREFDQLPRVADKTESLTIADYTVYILCRIEIL